MKKSQQHYLIFRFSELMAFILIIIITSIINNQMQQQQNDFGLLVHDFYGLFFHGSGLDEQTIRYTTFKAYFIIDLLLKIDFLVLKLSKFDLDMHVITCVSSVGLNRLIFKRRSRSDQQEPFIYPKQFVNRNTPLGCSQRIKLKSEAPFKAPFLYLNKFQGVNSLTT